MTNFVQFDVVPWEVSDPSDAAEVTIGVGAWVVLLDSLAGGYPRYAHVRHVFANGVLLLKSAYVPANCWRELPENVALVLAGEA